MKHWCLFPIAAGLLLTGCSTIPTGPSVLVLPGGGKDFEQFQADDAVCRQWALRQIGKAPAQASTEAAVTGAAVGTVVGAATGAAVGAASGQAATGAAVGSGVGLLGGTAIGADRGAYAEGVEQRRYDYAYIQCMYLKGNQIPVQASAQRAPAPPHPDAPPRMPPPVDVPPPPPGNPPPPPPGAGW